MMEKDQPPSVEQPILDARRGVIADIGVTIVDTEVIKDEAGHDKWLKYTVESDGETHCVGTRLEPLISDDEFDAIEAARATRSVLRFDSD